MNEAAPTPEIQVAKPWYRKELTIFVGGSILVAFLLVVMSLAIYTSSGDALLDASRPGFKSIQKEVNQSDNFEAFSTDGPVDSSTIDQFQQLYTKQVQSVGNSSVFDNSALSDQALGIDDPSATDTTQNQ